MPEKVQCVLLHTDKVFLHTDKVLLHTDKVLLHTDKVQCVLLHTDKYIPSHLFIYGQAYGHGNTTRVGLARTVYLHRI